VRVFFAASRATRKAVCSAGGCIGEGGRSEGAVRVFFAASRATRKAVWGSAGGCIGGGGGAATTAGGCSGARCGGGGSVGGEAAGEAIRPKAEVAYPLRALVCGVWPSSEQEVEPTSASACGSRSLQSLSEPGSSEAE
jgi:hypothetical protein